MTVQAVPSQCSASVRNWQRPPGRSPTAHTSAADRAAKPSTSYPLGGLKEVDQVTPAAAATGSATTAAADTAAVTSAPRRSAHPGVIQCCTPPASCRHQPSVQGVPAD